MQGHARWPHLLFGSLSQVLPSHVTLGKLQPHEDGLNSDEWHLQCKDFR